MSETDLPDAEGVVRDYLRQDAGVTALFGQRIFFGVPDGAVFPVCTVQRIGGGLDDTEGLADLGLLQLDVFGEIYGKADAFAGLSAILNSLNSVHNYTSGTTRLLGANVQSYAFLPDETERARYSVTVQVYCAPV